MMLKTFSGKFKGNYNIKCKLDLLLPPSSSSVAFSCWLSLISGHMGPSGATMTMDRSLMGLWNTLETLADVFPGVLMTDVGAPIDVDRFFMAAEDVFFKARMTPRSRSRGRASSCRRSRSPVERVKVKVDVGDDMVISFHFSNPDF